ncbi:hypothetical protein V3C99_009307, partial [Haemonchus contortus]
RSGARNAEIIPLPQGTTPRSLVTPRVPVLTTVPTAVPYCVESSKNWKWMGSAIRSSRTLACARWILWTKRRKK